MKIFITEYDRYNTFRAALLTTARFHNIADYEFKSNNELYYEIKQIGSPLFDPLNTYLKAYDKWFDFFNKRKKIEDETEEEYQLSNTEKGELALLITAKQDSLNSLQTRFDNLKSS